MSVKRFDWWKVECDLCPSRSEGPLSTLEKWVRFRVRVEFAPIGLSGEAGPDITETLITICPNCSARSYRACGEPPSLQPIDVRVRYVMRRAAHLVVDWLATPPRLA